MITVNGVERSWRPGLTINDILQDLAEKLSIVVVKIDGKVIQKKQHSTYEIPDGAKVVTLDVIAGG